MTAAHVRDVTAAAHVRDVTAAAHVRDVTAADEAAERARHAAAPHPEPVER